MTSTGSRDEQGASAVEYGLLVSGIALLIFAIVLAFGGGVDGLLSGSCDTINQEISSSNCSP